MRVELFVTCITDTLYPQTGKAVVGVLERLGCAVGFDARQTCCGQMHHNSGYARDATALVRRFVTLYGEAEAVVVPASSCTAMIAGQYALLAQATGDDGLVRAVEAITPRVHEFTAFLTDVLGVEDVGAYYPHRVTYHASCNALRALNLGERPLRLLRAVRGLELVELGRREECCGFGGTFAVKNAETSTAMLTDKLRHVLDTRAEVCTGVDNSCLMHIGGGLSRQRSGVRTLHLAEILASTETALAS